MSTVLWGARRGDVQYGGREYWRRHIPIGAAVIEVSHAVWFSPGGFVENIWTGEMFEVVGIEPPSRIGVLLP